MKQILLLTKNIFIDIAWQNKIQQLGYEVFCSNQLLESFLLKQEASVFDFFKTVIFSESISNEEVASVLEFATSDRLSFYRIDEQQIAEETIEGPTDHGAVKILNSQMSLNELREALADTKAIKIFATVYPQRSEEPQEEISIHSVTALISAMSKKERELFDILYEHNGEFVTRIELSKLLWTQGVSNSSLTQLSQIVGRLKKKMHKLGLNEGLIETHWNKGYAFKNQFCESISNYAATKSI
ncbi:winged helix-turn-helix domain-containing protein [Enterococcus sp. LJL120]